MGVSEQAVVVDNTGKNQKEIHSEISELETQDISETEFAGKTVEEKNATSEEDDSIQFRDYKIAFHFPNQLSEKYSITTNDYGIEIKENDADIINLEANIIYASYDVVKNAEDYHDWGLSMQTGALLLFKKYKYPKQGVTIYSCSERVEDTSYTDNNPHWKYEERLIALFGKSKCNDVIRIEFPKGWTSEQVVEWLDYVDIRR